jgi:hypothetical protein
MTANEKIENYLKKNVRYKHQRGLHPQDRHGNRGASEKLYGDGRFRVRKTERGELLSEPIQIREGVRVAHQSPGGWGVIDMKIGKIRSTPHVLRPKERAFDIFSTLSSAKKLAEYLNKKNEQQELLDDWELNH